MSTELSLVTKLIDAIGLGDAVYPVQKMMGLKQITVAVAHIAIGSRGNLPTTFTSNQENKFAELQILCNTVLKSRGLHTIPLFHLTPRMFVGHVKEPVSNEDNGRPDDYKVNVGSKKTFRKKRGSNRINQKINNSKDTPAESEFCHEDDMERIFNRKAQGASACERKNTEIMGKEEDCMEGVIRNIQGARESEREIAEAFEKDEDDTEGADVSKTQDFTVEIEKAEATRNDEHDMEGVEARKAQGATEGGGR